MCIYTNSPSEFRGFSMCASKKGKSFSNSILNGEVFFILSEKPVHDKLKEIIILLKGKVETFFSKDITTLLVEDSHIEEYHLPYHAPNHHLNSRTPNDIPPPGRFIEQTIDKNIPTTSSRGYALLARSTSVHPRNYMDNYAFKVINMANIYGVKVIGIHKFMAWSHTVIKLPVSTQNVKTRVTKPKGIKIPGHFIKIEDIAQRFRPLYRVLPEESVRNFEQLNPNCVANNYVPDNCANDYLFHQPDPRHVVKEGVAGAAVNTTKEFVLKADFGGAKPKCNVKNVSKAKPKAKKKPQQYCECCNVNFSNLAQHIKGAKHQAFATNDSNYQCIIDIIKHFPTPQEFIENHQRKYLKKIHSETFNVSSTPGSTSLLTEAAADGSKNMLVNSSVPVVNSNFNQGMLSLKNSNACFLDLHKLALNANECAKEESQKDLETSVSLVPQEIHISDIFSQKSGFVTGVDLSVQDYEDCWVDVFQECDMNQDSLFAGESFSISNAEHSISQVFKTEGNNSLSFKEFASNEIAQPPNIGASVSTSLLNTEATCSTKSSFVVPAGDGSSKHQVDNPGNCNQRSLSQKDLNFDFNSELNFLNSAFEDSKLESFSFNNLNMSNSHMPDVYFEKSDQVNPCSSFLPVRAEHMFSSSSSDDETDGKSIINNVLSIINKSASEVEVGNDKSRSSHESKLKSPLFKKNASETKVNVDDKPVTNSVLNVKKNVVEDGDKKPKTSGDLAPTTNVNDAGSVKDCSKLPWTVSKCEIKSENMLKAIEDLKVCSDGLQNATLRDELKPTSSNTEVLVYNSQNATCTDESLPLINSKLSSETVKNQFLGKVHATDTKKRETELEKCQSKGIDESKATDVEKPTRKTEVCDAVDRVLDVNEFKPLDFSYECERISPVPESDLKPMNADKTNVKSTEMIPCMEKEIKTCMDVEMKPCVGLEVKPCMDIEMKPCFSENNMLHVSEFKNSFDYQKYDEEMAVPVTSFTKVISIPQSAKCEVKTEDGEKQLDTVCKLHYSDHENTPSREVDSSKVNVAAAHTELPHIETENGVVKVCDDQEKKSLDVVKTSTNGEMCAPVDFGMHPNIPAENGKVQLYDTENMINTDEIQSYKYEVCIETKHDLGADLTKATDVKTSGSPAALHGVQYTVLNEDLDRFMICSETCTLTRSHTVVEDCGRINQMCNSQNTMGLTSEVKCEDELNMSDRMEISSVDETEQPGCPKVCNEMDITSGTSGVILPHYSDVSSEASVSSGEYFLHTYGLPKPSSLWTVQPVSEDKMRLKFSRVRNTCGNFLIKPKNNLSGCAEYSDAMDTGS